MELQLNLDFDDAAPVAKKVRLSRDQGKGLNFGSTFGLNFGIISCKFDLSMTKN